MHYKIMDFYSWLGRLWDFCVVLYLKLNWVKLGRCKCQRCWALHGGVVGRNIQTVKGLWVELEGLQYNVRGLRWSRMRWEWKPVEELCGSREGERLGDTHVPMEVEAMPLIGGPTGSCLVGNSCQSILSRNKGMGIMWSMKHYCTTKTRW